MHRQLTTDCNFGTSDLITGHYASFTMLPLDIMLKVRFVYGLREPYIQQRAFAKQDLFLKTAYNIALHVEDAVKQQEDQQSHTGDVQESATVPGHRNANAARSRPPRSILLEVRRYFAPGIVLPLPLRELQLLLHAK